MPLPKLRLIAAPHTPFSQDHSLRLQAIEQQAEVLSQQNVSGVFVGGTTGEGLSLSYEERLELNKRWVDVASGTSLQVILHVGSNSLPEAQGLAQQAHRIGADAISVLAPSYFKPASLDDLLDFCAAVAKEAPQAPFYYYHIPGMTGCQHSMVQLLTRAPEKIPTFSGLKYSSLDLVQLQECLHVDPDRFEIFFGSDEALLAAWALGVRAAVGSTYNFAAPLYDRMVQAFQQGDSETAQREQYRSVRLVRLMQEYGFLAASKHAMSLLGVDCGPVRLPLRSLTPAQQQELTERLEALDVLHKPVVSEAPVTSTP